MLFKFVSFSLESTNLNINPHLRYNTYTDRFQPLISVLFYPVIPVLAYVNLLWAKPKRSAGKTASSSAKFREAEYFACIAHAICGGIGTPVQLIFQVQMRAFFKYNLLFFSPKSISS